MNKIIEIEKTIEIITEELNYAFVTDITKDENSEIIYKGENTNFLDEHPIKIETLIKDLQRIKDAGCNYVSVGYDVDHYQYILEGYKVESK